MPKQILFTSLIALIFGLAIFAPYNAFGQSCPTDMQVSEGVSGGFTIFRGGLVPCGRHCDDPGTPTNETATCTLCHFILLFYNVYNLLLALLIIIALLFLTIGGVVYIVSSGNSGLKATAKNVITKTLTGFALFLLSWLIVYTILFFISANPDGNAMLGRGSWYQFTCNGTSAF